MAESADDDRASQTAVHAVNRRTLVGGLASLGSLVPTIGVAQAPPLDPSTAPHVSKADLLANLLTRMATRVQLNGRAGFTFVIDTGAGRTALADDVAETLALPRGPTVLVHGVTSAQPASTVHLARLTVGPRRMTDLSTPIFPRRLLGADGLLGLDVLSRFELAFDLSRLTVAMTPSGPDIIAVSQSHAAASRLTRRIPARARAGRFGQLILLNTEVDGVAVEAFVDSGAQYSIANLALLRALGGGRAERSDRAQIIVHGVTGQTALAQPDSVRELKLAGQRLGVTPLLFADLHAFRLLDLIDRPALLIGADILYRFQRVTLDFGRSRMVFGGLRRPVTRG